MEARLEVLKKVGGQVDKETKVGGLRAKFEAITAAVGLDKNVENEVLEKFCSSGGLAGENLLEVDDDGDLVGMGDSADSQPGGGV